MTEAVIVSTARTPIATSFKGSLVNVDAFTLAKRTLEEIVDRSGVDPERIDDVLLGETLYGGGDVARYAAVEAGMLNAPGMAMNRHCASGLSAEQIAAGSIRSDMDPEAVLAQFPERVVYVGGGPPVWTAYAPYIRHWDITRLPYDGDADRWFDPAWLTAS